MKPCSTNHIDMQSRETSNPTSRILWIHMNYRGINKKKMLKYLYVLIYRSIKREMITWKRAFGNCGLASSSCLANSLFFVAITCHVRIKPWYIFKAIHKKLNEHSLNIHLQVRNDFIQLVSRHFCQMKS